jgi:SAM-dependent methyltransferase
MKNFQALTMNDWQKLHEENRLSWNAATLAHNSHKKDQAAFLRGGGSTLFREEIELLGKIEDLRLVHLQCNSGQDTLSLAHLGAKVTGVDISDEAITIATRLSEDSGIPAKFERADVYDWLENAPPASFDLVFCSYGAICWLSDLKRWAQGVAKVLVPGGRFVDIEFHPIAMIFDDDWSHRYNYFAEGNVLTWEEGIRDYVALSGEGLSLSGYEEGIKDFKNPHRCHEFQWATSEILTALIEAGLHIEIFKEYPYANGCKLYSDMQETEGRRMWPPANKPNLPLMYSIVARK